jgi:hypothetical protein
MNDHTSRVRTFLILSCIATVVVPIFGYIDSGLPIIQFLIGGVLGIGVALKLGWRRIVGIFSRKKSKVG